MIKATLADVIDESWEINSDLDPQGLIEYRKLVVDCQRACKDILGRIDGQLSKDLGKGLHNVGSCEVRVSASSPVRSGWDIETLLRDVLDTRVWTDQGDLIEETPAEKILKVWGLAAPRLTELKVRGLDPDDYCRVRFEPKVTIR